MAEPDTMRKIVRDYHQGVTRRTEAALQLVGEAVYTWMVDNLTGPLRADWRQRLHGVWAEQAARGRTVVPESTAAFEAAIERYSELCAQTGIYLPPPKQLVFPDSVGPADNLNTPRATPPNAPVPVLDASLVRRAHSNAGHPRQPIEELSSPFRLASDCKPSPKTAPVPAVARRANHSAAESSADMPEPTVPLAGAGPATSAAFRAEVLFLLQLLDPAVAAWWKGSTIRGRVLAYKASPLNRWLGRDFYVEVKGKQPSIFVDQFYDAAKTAATIIAEARDNKFSLFSQGFEVYDGRIEGEQHQLTQIERLRVGAAYAGGLAKLYYEGIAGFSPAGDLVVTLGDIADRGFAWDQLWSVLPLVGELPVGALILNLGERKIKISKQLASQLENLGDARRGPLLAKAASAKSDDEAAAIIKHGVLPESKPPLPPPVAEVRLKKPPGGKSPHPSHVIAAQSEEAAARAIHAYPGEVVIRWGKKLGANGPDVISYNPDTKLVTLWDDKYRSASRRIDPSKTFANESPALAKSLNETELAIKSSTLPPAHKAAALKSLREGRISFRTIGSGNAKNSTIGGNK